MALLDSALAYNLRVMIAEAGQQITLIRRTTLSGPNPAPNPPLTENLVVNGAVLAGVSAISFRADILTGRVISGDQFTITGDATVYTISGQVISPTTADTLTAVPFTPVLAQNAADGAAVVITPTAQTALNGLVTHFPPSVFVTGTTILETDLRVQVMASDLGVLVPRAGDLILADDGAPWTVVNVKAVGVHNAIYAYFLHVRT